MHTVLALPVADISWHVQDMSQDVAVDQLVQYQCGVLLSDGSAVNRQ